MNIPTYLFIEKSCSESVKLLNHIDCNVLLCFQQIKFISEFLVLSIVTFYAKSITVCKKIFHPYSPSKPRADQFHFSQISENFSCMHRYYLSLVINPLSNSFRFANSFT